MASRPLKRLLWYPVAAYLGVCLVLSLLENKMVYPSRVYPAGDWAPQLVHEDVQFRSSDGTALHGWLLPSPQPTSLWVVFFHGNAEHVADCAPELDLVRSSLPANVFVFDYRGYGRSEGSPKEPGVLADGRAAVEWVCQDHGLTPEQLVLHGRSLGGAVAIDVASRLGARALIVERTFTSMTDVAACHYPWLPIRWLMRNRYENMDKIARFHGPLLVSHGADDEIVPFAQAERLFAAAGSEHKVFHTMPGASHNSPADRAFYEQLFRFLRELPEPAPAT